MFTHGLDCAALGPQGNIKATALLLSETVLKYLI